MNELHADYGSDELSTVIRHPQKVTTLVGDQIEFALTGDRHVQTNWILTRRPAGSAANLASRRFRADVPGLFVLSIEVDEGWAREIAIAAFPREALARVGFGPLPERGADPNALARRLRLRGIVNDTRATAQTIAACLEPPGDPCLGLAGALLGENSLNLNNYGGFYL